MTQSLDTLLTCSDLEIKIPSTNYLNHIAKSIMEKITCCLLILKLHDLSENWAYMILIHVVLKPYYIYRVSIYCRTGNICVWSFGGKNILWNGARGKENILHAQWSYGWQGILVCTNMSCFTVYCWYKQQFLAILIL